jgi:glycosyltransferase involved in cell wall biosynthesis
LEQLKAEMLAMQKSAVGSNQEAAQANGGWQVAEGTGRPGESGFGLHGSRILDLDDLSEVEKQNALAACDILCVPSEGESFGMVYFEAWAYKKPVVTLDIPVLRETVGASGGGLLVQGNPVSIAGAITELLGDVALRQRMGEDGHRLACRHRWDKTVNYYERAYDQAHQNK